MAAGKSVSNDLLPEKARGAGDSNVHRSLIARREDDHNRRRKRFLRGAAGG